MTKRLTLPQRRFIAEMQTGITGTQAAINAGYSPTSAKHRAYALLNENPLVMAEMARLQQHLVATAEYNIERASADLDRFIEAAFNANQHSAVAKHQEQKMKLHLLIRKQIDVTVAPAIDITGALHDAKERALRPRCDPADTIDVEFEALPSVAATRPIDTQSVARGGYGNALDLDL